MKSKLTTIVLALLIVLAAGWGIMWYLRKTVVPKMEFQTNELLLTGSNTTTTMNDLKGKVVIVSYFQTWCGPCIQEMYIFEELITTIKSPDLKILCISDEDRDHIKQLQDRITYDKVLFAHSPKSLASLGIHVYPTTYLLNKKGEVVLSKLEGYNWALEKGTIEKLLKGTKQ
ncbi:MAG: TlpA disulfide reductase family protein [Ferruginibacter sp.]